MANLFELEELFLACISQTDRDGLGLLCAGAHML